MFALMVTLPLMSSSAIPAVAKVGIAFFCAYIALPVMVTSGYYVPESVVSYILLLLAEVVVGLTLGFVVQLFFSVFQVAGELFSVQMGFSAASVFDPIGMQELPILGQFLNLFAMLIFLASNGLVKVFYVGIVKSFDVIRPSEIVFSSEPFFEMFVTSIGKVFGQALIIAFPIIGTLFLASLTLGLLAKAAPQLNLLMLGFPINIAVGFFILILALPILGSFIANFIDQIYYVMEDAIIYLSG
ncbi:MAG: flagellar biosynthetic protein FliR [Spirochaetales bacterium]|nr:flagellar biosynthetic protein FliR [Spirochaetales bacterium]